MNEPAPQPALQPTVRARGGLSLVWLIPLVTVLIGGWLVVRTIRLMVRSSAAALVRVISYSGTSGMVHTCPKTAGSRLSSSRVRRLLI